MKKVRIENKQKQGRKWESAEVQIPESFKELAQHYHNGNTEQAGAAIFKYAFQVSRLAVTLRQHKDPQYTVDQICSGKLQTVSAKANDYIADKIATLLASGKLDAQQLSKLLACKTRKDKIRFLANLETQEQKAEAEAKTGIQEKPKKPKKTKK